MNKLILTILIVVCCTTSLAQETTPEQQEVLRLKTKKEVDKNHALMAKDGKPYYVFLTADW